MNNQSYHLELLGIYKSLSDDKKEGFTNRFSVQAYNPTVVFGYSVFLGTLGVDRFVLGQVGLGIIKLLTIGGLGFWQLLICFSSVELQEQRISKSLEQSRTPLRPHCPPSNTLNRHSPSGVPSDVKIA
jgi:hypothetical protein